MSVTAELVALAERIEAVPSYDGAQLDATFYQFGTPPSTAKPDVRVILVPEKWRSTIASALRYAAR